MRARLTVLTTVVLLALAAPATAATPRDPRLAGVHSFAFAIGDGTLRGDVTGRYAPFDLVIVDGEEATKAQVAALHARGKIVLGYLSVGTIERGRFWFRAARPYRLDLWDDFGEWYADVARPGFRRLITRRVAPALMRKGFDGLFLDNVDMVETHASRRAGMRVLVRTLARGRELLFAQNGEGFEGGLARYLDGWNREDVTSTYDFGRRSYTRTSAQARRDAQAELRRMAARGLLVTATDYVAAGDSAGESDSVAGACAAGALPYVADIGLTRVPASPFTCP